MPTLTTWLSGALLIIPKRRKSHRMISCASGVSTLKTASETFRSRMRSPWINKLLLVSSSLGHSQGRLPDQLLSQLRTWVGRSDMEGPERTWFGLQGGGLTKDQGPGYWNNAMDDKLGHWNWSKLVRLGMPILFPLLRMITSLLLPGPLLAKKYATALTQATTHSDEFTALCINIPKYTLDSWTEKIISWEDNRNQPNPYFNPSSGTSDNSDYDHL